MASTDDIPPLPVMDIRDPANEEQKALQKRLHNAIEAKNPKAVHKAIAKGANPFTITRLDDDTALHPLWHAVNSGDPQTLTALLHYYRDEAVSVDSPNTGGDTALSLLIEAYAKDKTIAVIKGGLSFEQTAALNNKVVIAGLLLEAGADPNRWVHNKPALEQLYQQDAVTRNGLDDPMADMLQKHGALKGSDSRIALQLEAGLIEHAEVCFYGPWFDPEKVVPEARIGGEPLVQDLSVYQNNSSVGLSQDGGKVKILILLANYPDPNVLQSPEVKAGYEKLKQAMQLHFDPKLYEVGILHLPELQNLSEKNFILFSENGYRELKKYLEIRGIGADGLIIQIKPETQLGSHFGEKIIGKNLAFSPGIYPDGRMPATWLNVVAHEANHLLGGLGGGATHYINDSYHESHEEYIGNFKAHITSELTLASTAEAWSRLTKSPAIREAIARLKPQLDASGMSCTVDGKTHVLYTASLGRDVMDHHEKSAPGHHITYNTVFYTNEEMLQQNRASPFTNLSRDLHVFSTLQQSGRIPKGVTFDEYMGLAVASPDALLDVAVSPGKTPAAPEAPGVAAASPKKSPTSR